MALVGYADPLSAAPGETVSFHVSCAHEQYHADVVRLRHGNEDPAGPGLRVSEVETAIGGSHPGRRQPLHPGSYLHVPRVELPAAARAGLAVCAWVRPTLPARGERQGIVALRAGAQGLRLGLEPEGDLSVRVGEQVVRTGVALDANEWHFVGAWLEDELRSVRLAHEPLVLAPHRVAPVLVSAALEQQLALERCELTVGAGWRGEQLPGGAAPAGELFDGRIARPLLAAGLDAEAGRARLRDLERPERLDAGELVAAWDFSREMASATVPDVGPGGFDGRLVNGPARAVPGPGWRGVEIDWRQAQDEYDAIHVHADDLEDAGWEADLALELPADMPSGFYALRLRAGEDEDHIPFFVRPPVGGPSASIAFLVPTVTYLAYANLAQSRRRLAAEEPRRAAYPTPFSLHPNDHELDRHPEVGGACYDDHADGSPVYYSSWRRPLLSLRPGYTSINTGEGRHLAGELYLEDWLVELGHAHDVITDHDLHHDGFELLRHYRVLLVGTHPEYWTTPMMDAFERYLAAGGRVMYLGGNGFFWVTAINAERPWVVEVRRGVQLPGRMLAAAMGDENCAGEGHTSSTGEASGFWRVRGRPERRLVGVGYAASGWPDRNPGYRRAPGSFDERARFIFEGIGDDEVLGDFGLSCGGAAGDELDRADVRYGTPQHALVLATSQGLHDPAVVGGVEAGRDGPPADGVDPNVRADMVFFETAGGGAVFSVGSIAYCGSLSHNGYDNNISRITDNVLRAFAAAPEAVRAQEVRA
jgi:N,N-dimethylformamidase